MYPSYPTYPNHIQKGRSWAERDVDHKDKQDFDAVLNIIRPAPLLQDLHDALATKHYVEIRVLSG